MPKLNDNYEALIVTMLARYYRPRDISALFKEDYGIELTMGEILCYSPDNPLGYDLPEIYRKNFYQERERYKQGEPETASFIPDVRMRKLEKMADMAMDKAEELGADKKPRIAEMDAMLGRAQVLLEQIRIETAQLSLPDTSKSSQEDRKAQILALFGVGQFDENPHETEGIERLLRATPLSNGT